MKNMIASLNKTNGFSLIETMVAIGVISVIGIVGSRALLNSTRAVANINYHQKASSLADMIFQQYNSYSAQNYQALTTYNVTSVSPSTFFSKPNNMGFDNFSITTLASYATDRSTATVTVTLGWNEGSKSRSASYVRIYTQSINLAGGSVQVYVVSPCQGYTDPNQILANCPGLKGFSVSAPSYSGTNSPVTTDSTGLAWLKNIMVGTSINVSIAAPPSPTDFSIPPTDSHFVQGYYAQDPITNAYVLTITTTTSVQAPVLGKLIVTNFQPAGRIFGNVTNLSTVEPNPPVSGMTLRLANGPTLWQTAQGGYAACSSCTVQSGADGSYSFNNVIPGAFQLNVDGRQGSAPTVQPGQAGFSWGYTGQQVYNNTLASNPSGAAPTLQQNVNIVVDGWTKLLPYNVVTNDPVKNYSIVAIITNSLSPNPQGIPSQITVTTDANGISMLYNVVPANGYESLFTGYTFPSGSDYGSKVEWGTWGASIGGETDFNVPVQPGYLLTAQIADVAGHANNIQVSQPGLVTVGFSGSTDGMGFMTFKGFMPSGSWNSSTPLLPTIPFQVPEGLRLTNSNLGNDTAITGGTVDSATGSPAAHASLLLQEQFGVEATITTDGNGNFPAGLRAKLPYVNMTIAPGTLNLWEVCDSSTLQCTLCNDSVGCTVGSPNTVTIDTSQSIGFFPSTAYMNIVAGGGGYYNLADAYASIFGNVLSGHIPMTFLSALIEGTVVDPSNHGISGITLPGVGDSDGVTVVTDSRGHFGPGWAYVSGRTGPSNPGTVNITVPAQQSYNASSVSWPVPFNADATVPISNTITLTPTGNGGGI